MTISPAELFRASDRLVESALIGEDWRRSLALLAKSAGASGATLVRHNPRDGQNLVDRSEFVLATDTIAEFVDEYLTGLAPPDPRLSRVSPSSEHGFVTDFDQFTLDEINKDPFYEEFLRPRNLRWHACAQIDSSPKIGQLYLSLKRGAAGDPYGPLEVGWINDTLPKIRMAAAISRSFLNAEAQGAKKQIERRGEMWLEFDARGSVISWTEEADTLFCRFFDQRSGWLIAPCREDQARLDRALETALSGDGGVACTVLATTNPDCQIVFRAMPVTGVARNVLGAAAAIAVVTLWRKPNLPPKSVLAALREAYGLTASEAQVTALVGFGHTPAESAAILAIGLGTARNYLKSAKSKMGLSRQAELVSLVSLL
ncbi:MAG: helix-turn-helix transcriptional regulator [Pseudomonadota bacterium]